MAFLFTIEQIELVRRLRRTGMSKEQVWKAYEEMDRLDGELNANDNCNQINGNLNANPNSVPMLTKTSTNVNSCQTLAQNDFHSSGDQEMTIRPIPTLPVPTNRTNSQTLQTQHNCYSMEKSLNPLSALNQSFNESLNEDSLTISPIPSTQTDISGQALAVCHQRQQINAYFASEESQELIEFKKKGETVMLSEIRGFVNKYNIRQIMIAEMTKISQGYVSRFFRGEGQDMSEKSKNLIYLWYISVRSRPEILSHFCPQTIGERRTQLTESGDLLPIRRDRFIFRREHLLVLDQYFKLNPYPDSSTKEMIAEECNTSVEKSTRRALKDKDKVTLSVVSNWFNNKRKETKSKRLPQNQSFGSQELNQNCLPFVTETSLFSNNSSNSIEELETRPDLSVMTDFEGQECIELSDEEDSRQSFSGNDYMNEMKPNFVIKLETNY